MCVCVCDSFLTSWAANELALVQDIKNIKSHYGILSLIEKAYNLNYSDTRLKQIEQILISLTSEPSGQDTLEDKPITKEMLVAELSTIFKT